MIKEIFKKNIASVHPYEPGKPIKELERELGLRHVIKLASNENALGPSRKALRAMRRAILEAHLYPESKCYYLTNRLSREWDIPAEHLIIGNGSNEIIELLMRGFVSEGDEVLSSDTSFLVYPILTQVCGARYVSVPMKNFCYDLDAMAEAISDRTRIIFIANPNNPTGTYVTHDHVLRFLDRVPKHVIVCFDEAYFDFVEATDFPRTLEWVREKRKNIILMRTFSKSYGLAGLRIGYGMGAPDVMEYLHKIRQPFNVNAIAQAAATAALDDRFFLWRTKHMVSQGRKFFYRRLPKLGVEYVPSQGNFILMNTGRPANELFQALLRKGVIIRSMKAYGLDTWIRVTIGRRSQNAHFYRVLKNFLTQGF